MLIVGCAKQSAKEFFDIAEDARKSKDYERALGNYSRAVQEYPKSEFAEESQFSIGTILQNNTHKFRDAIAAYKRYIDLYPEGKKAPVALFLIGYIYNNDLNMLDSAAAAYRRFLAEYPNHEMAPSAQFELSNLGKPPEELLPRPALTEEKPPQQPLDKRAPRQTKKN